MELYIIDSGACVGFHLLLDTAVESPERWFRVVLEAVRFTSVSELLFASVCVSSCCIPACLFLQRSKSRPIALWISESLEEGSQAL